MALTFEVNANKLIEAVAKKLEKDALVQPPAWAAFVKTGVSKERPPVRKDWWYARSASILRSVYKLGPIGTSKLQKKYGGRKNRGYKPEHFFTASGAVIRNILKQLEKSSLLKQVEKGVHKGRIITPKGKSLLDKTAKELMKISKSE